MLEENEIRHSSSKEERDILLEYKLLDLTRLKKTDIISLPIDNITIDESIAKIQQLIDAKERMHHVLFVDPIKLMYLRKGKKLHRIAEKASMILAEGAGLSWASYFLYKQRLADRISIIGLMMDLFRLAELKSYTIFLLGSTEERIEKVFFNLLRHFPEIRIVGRHTGFMSKEWKVMVKEAIRKTNPDIIFVGFPFPEQELWIEANSQYIGNAVVIGVGGAFDVLSGQKKKAPDSFQLKGLTWLWRIIARPWSIIKIWKAILFFLMLPWEKFKLWKEKRAK